MACAAGEEKRWSLGRAAGGSRTLQLLTRGCNVAHHLPATRRLVPHNWPDSYTQTAAITQCCSRLSHRRACCPPHKQTAFRKASRQCIHSLSATRHTSHPPQRGSGKLDASFHCLDLESTCRSKCCQPSGLRIRRAGWSLLCGKPCDSAVTVHATPKLANAPRITPHGNASSCTQLVAHQSRYAKRVLLSHSALRLTNLTLLLTSSPSPLIRATGLNPLSCSTYTPR